MRGLAHEARGRLRVGRGMGGAAEAVAVGGCAVLPRASRAISRPGIPIVQRGRDDP